MSSLRAKAEAEALALFDDLPIRGNHEDSIPQMTEAIEKLAREFADKALRASLAESLPNPDGSGKVEAMRAKIIAAAIAAAEGDE